MVANCPIAHEEVSMKLLRDCKYTGYRLGEVLLREVGTALAR